MKKVIVLCGVGGVGKTHARLNHPELKDLPQADIADSYREAQTSYWRKAHMHLAQKVNDLLGKHDIVVVEGYYLPDSASRHLVVKSIEAVWGSSVEFDFRLMVEIFETCKQRIEDSGFNVGVRTEILESTWNEWGDFLLSRLAQGKVWRPEYGQD